jgi:hypothetical protein
MRLRDLVFFRRRSTPQVVEHGAEAGPKDGYGAPSSRRAATAEEERTNARLQKETRENH